MYSTCSVYVAARGATGGTLDIYIQTLFKQLNASPGMWVDVAHLPQQAAAGALTGYTFALTRWSPTTAAIFTPVNTVCRYAGPWRSTPPCPASSGTSSGSST
jgi:hypothetical protein